MTPEAALVAGLLAGLFGSTHCVAMCGGIMAVLHGQVPRGRDGLAAGFHLGRISSYLTLALLLTALGSLPAQLLPGTAGPVMRVALGALLLLMAVYVALPGRFRDVVGELAAPLTARVQPLIGQFLPADRWSRALGLGLLWGLLPCGLLYSVLAAAVLLADPLPTVAMVAGFGVGTLPLLLGGGLVAVRLKQRIRAPWFRLPAAALLALAGLAVAFGPSLAHHLHHPAVRFLVDCISAG
ncbi:MAG: sulfite exporter TauE/SafE family protein [Wenzhouxiangellaceae bacterium]|nr:sulfite exporter TauE/SafE family protein [Wenzhouxiangellaceae bacterium]